MKGGSTWPCHGRFARFGETRMNSLVRGLSRVVGQRVSSGQANLKSQRLCGCEVGSKSDMACGEL